MKEHDIFYLMAFGPAILACGGVLLLLLRWYAKKDERKHGVPENVKAHKRVKTAGILLLIPFLCWLAARAQVMLRPR